MKAVTAHGIRKTYGRTNALAGVDFEVDRGRDIRHHRP